MAESPIFVTDDLKKNFKMRITGKMLFMKIGKWIKKTHMFQYYFFYLENVIACQGQK